MAMLPKGIYRFNTIPINISTPFSTNTEKKIQKSVWRHERPKITKAILNKIKTAGGITIPDFKLYHRAIALK